jgi:acrylyl-CoA reductase (NADPH)
MIDALLLDDASGTLTADVRSVSEKDLPEGDVQVAVAYSSLNYKDALAVTGEGIIIRGDFPFVPGIDLVGQVEASAADAFAPGDWVIQTGWGLGEHRWGGYAQQMRLKAEHLVPLPDGMTPREAMIVGTAGFTAMLAVMALEDHNTTPTDGEVVVTGASGGAGSIAVALLSARGYRVVASTGTEAAHDDLRDLGAARIVGRDAFDDGPERPMQSARWAGAIDAVGGATLATLIAELERHASVAAFGNAGGHELHTSVFPFILRGVNLLGIDSNTCPNDRRRIAWHRLADTLTDVHYERVLNRVIGLDEVVESARAVLQGNIQGRIVVDVNA